MTPDISPVQSLDALLKAHRFGAACLPAPAAGRHTRDEIIAPIKRWNETYGAPLVVVDRDPTHARPSGQAWRAERFKAGGWPTTAMVRRQFGNLSNAVFAAGLRPRRGPKRPRSHVRTDDDILACIREWTRTYGEPPSIADWSPARARTSGQAWRIERYYAGNWTTQEAA